ncbi:MAG: DNA primase [Dethiobacteria bacterium]|nr:DNA primase [Bacillota bacterium]NMD33730.1 DNA primase [Bacillota bacterium]HPZ41827.1 DNA primase [Bacillota bacterium]HQD52733.1 DNA primase [Bacillota bacterium]
MAQGIPEHVIDEIRQRCDLVSLVEEYLALEKRGKNLLGLCPFHSEKTPSFTVTPEKQLFYCFGCGASGNVFNFIMKMENLEFPEAARFLARKTGVKIPEARAARGEESRLKEQIFALNRLAASYFTDQLWHSSAGNKAAAYLLERGINRESSELFELGYAPPGWQSLTDFAHKEGVTGDLLLKAGLVSPRQSGGYYDRFRDRLIFPIFNLNGKVAGFGARALETGDKSGPKYLNSPETPVFEKGAFLYGLHLARQKIRREKTAIIVEGYTDVITAFQAGIKNVVASLGTALTPAQGRLTRSQAEKVIIAYDADSAGESATWRGLKILQDSGCLVEVADLPEDSDPDELIRQHGASFFKEILARAKPLSEYRLEVLKRRYDPSSEESRLRFLEEALLMLREMPNLVERDIYLQRVAEELGVSEGAVRRELQRQLKSQRVSGKHNLLLKDQTKNINQVKANPAEKMLISLMLQSEEAAGMVAGSLEATDFPEGPLRQVVEIILKLEGEGRPLSGEVLIDYFSDGEIHNLITAATTDPSVQGLSPEKLTRMTRDCIERINREKLARQQELHQRVLKEIDQKKQYDDQAKKILQEQLQVIKRLKGTPYRSGGGENLHG